jgi:apolipoprotein N-acyltransferase
MESNDKTELLLLTVGATILSGAAWWLSTNLTPQAWLAWLAPLPLLLVAPRMRWQIAALAAFCAGACNGLNLWHYLCGVIGLPAATAVLIAVMGGVKFALCLLLHRHCLRAGQPGRAAVAFPALWVALDYLGTLGAPHGMFGTFAHSQIDVLPVLQLASLTGLWGISFIVLLAPSALAVALSSNLDRRHRALTAGGAALMIVATFGYGFVRLQEPASGSMSVGLTSLHGQVPVALATPEGKALLQRYLAVIDRLASQGAQALVLPETAFSADQPLIPELAAAAARNKIWIDAGVALKGQNQAVVYGPAASDLFSYAKHHLIPGFENQYHAGTNYTMLGTTQTGLAICKDMDFHDTGDAYAARGANLLLVPAWDFDIDGTMHSRIAMLRGIEYGFAVARAARRGNLTLSDDRGRIVAETSDAHRDAELVATLPLHQSHTLYARWGDWFVWVDLALLTIAWLPLKWLRASRWGRVVQSGADIPRPDQLY